MGRGTLGEVGLFLKKLLNNLCHQNYMKKRFNERHATIDEAFDQLSGDVSKFVDDQKLRDQFFRNNMIVPIDDVQRLLREISKENKDYVDKDELKDFLRHQ